MRSSDVTVIIPTHGRPDFMRAAVESALGQTSEPGEVVVVSDGSDPRNVEALAGLPVRYVEVPMGGVAQARNVGVALAEGTWVAFLDDDNLWHPEFLAHVKDHVGSREGVAAVNTGYWVFTADLRTAQQPVDFEASNLEECLAISARTEPTTSLAHLDITGRSFELLLARMAGSISSSVVRRDLVLAARGFPAGFVCAEDWTMFLNVSRFTEWHVVPSRLAFLRIHGANNTSARAALNGPATLRAIAAAWQEAQLPWPDPRPSRMDYREEYRFTVRGSLETASRARRWDLYRESIVLGSQLLTPVDLMRAAVPTGLVRKVMPARGRQAVRRVAGRSR